MERHKLPQTPSWIKGSGHIIWRRSVDKDGRIDINPVEGNYPGTEFDVYMLLLPLMLQWELKGLSQVTYTWGEGVISKKFESKLRVVCKLSI